MLTAVDVHSAYGSVPVLNGVSFHIRSGERVAILGRNGMGKTTLLRTVMGFLQCIQGKLEFNGRDITRLPPHKRARMGLGYVPQGREVFPGLTVRENLLMGAVATGVQKDRLEWILEQYPRLRERLTQRAGTMSGGEQQILSFGRALISDPSVLLLDEPTEGVQPSIVAEIQEDLLKNNEKLGVTIVVVEQNMEFATRVAQRIYLMVKGNIVRELSVNQLRDDPQIISEYLGV